MADNNTIKVQNLEVGSQVAITGELGFSRWLTELIDGENLQKRIAEDKARGSKFPTTVPFCEAQILNAEVICENPAAPTLTETYVHNHIFKNKDGIECFTVSKKRSLPVFGIRRGNHIEKFNPNGKHLGEGNKVTCYCNVYQPQNFPNKGFGLNAIVFENDPIWYTGSALPGGVWVDSAEDEQLQKQPAQTPQQSTPTQNPAATAPWSQPAPVSAPANNPWPAQSAPNSNPFDSAAAPVQGDGFAPAEGSPWMN